MTLLRALAMPFQWTSLLLVAPIAAAATLALSVEGALRILAVVPLFFLASWLNKYAFALLERAANGALEAPVATLEMLGPFGGARPLVHVVLGAVVLWLMSLAGPQRAAWVASAALLLFPASIGALAMHHRLLDAVSPLALWRTIRGLSLWYVLLLGALAACGAGALLIERSSLWRPLRIGLMELSLLCLYALLGAALYVRRVALGFEPESSPEWAAERDTQEYERRRQRAIDEIYAAIRVRDVAHARAALLAWLATADSERLDADLPALLAQAAQWPEQRGLQTVARTAIEQLLRSQRPSLALATATTALLHAPDFALDLETDTVTLARYALLCGRRPSARALLSNFVRSAPERPLSAGGQSLLREVETG